MLDCHIHLERGPYTIKWMDGFVNTAVKRGIDEIYLLEHSHRFIEFIPMYEEICHYSDFQNQWFHKRNDGKLSIQEYCRLIEQARQLTFPVKVKFGLEICYVDGFESLIKDVTDAFPFDFLTGSIHWVNGFGFDHKKELWEGKNVDEVYQNYYKSMMRLVKSGIFTGLAHPDSIKAFGHEPSYDLTDTYMELADLLNQYHMYAEESGGLHLNYGKQCELGMNQNMLRVFIDKGVKILTASDAHRPDDVGANIEEMEKILNINYN